MSGAGYELHIVHVQPVHKNLMNHADEDYREAGVTAKDAKTHEGKATDLVRTESVLIEHNCKAQLSLHNILP